MEKGIPSEQVYGCRDVRLGICYGRYSIVGAGFKGYARRGQLQEMRASSSQTGRLIDLYQQQLAQLSKAVAAANTQANAAVGEATAAKDSTAAAEKNLVVSERAWVSATVQVTGFKSTGGMDIKTP